MVKRIKVGGSIISNDDKWFYDWLELESTSPKDIESALNEAKGDDVLIEVNSGGGDVFSASEIYTRLKSYTGNVIVEIIGIAASAASVISMAGKTIRMSPTAQIMIHNASTSNYGDKNEFDKTYRTLTEVDESIANAYISKTGKSKDELLELMNKESWFNANSALENNFIDEIMFNTQPTFANNVGFSLPQNVLNKMKNDRLKMKELEVENQKLVIKLLEKGK